MIFFAVAFAVLLHVSVWGAGAAMLLMPQRWRRFWPMLILPAGWALQSLVVWLGAWANLRGTNSYAWPSELVPLTLLAMAWWRRNGRQRVGDITRFGLVWLAMSGALIALVLPLAIASHGLTTVSLGSCDAADYAAGARVFMEFAHGDREGFLGLTEVVRVMSVDNFFDFWLRLNHFTPSALIALNGTVLGCAPHELTGILTAVVLATGVPLVFWMARALFGYSGAASLLLAALYGFSPIAWYSFAHVSPAPLLASQAIALISWAGITLWKTRLTWRRAAQFAGVFAIGYTLVLGSYNFILLVCGVPMLTLAGAQTLRRGQWRRFAQWLLVVLAPLAGCGLVFWDRVAGLIERFRLFQTYDFGWHIPTLTPEGWLGMVQGGDLHAWSWAGVRWVLAAVVTGALGWALIRAVRERRQRVWLITSVIVPVLAGYVFLELRGWLRGTHASYDAYKLFLVFYPLLLPAFCWWITLRWSRRIVEWCAVVGFAGVVFGFNLVGCVMFIVALSRPPLIVDGPLRELRKVEAMPEITSINLLIPDMWSRLWANAFLLRKPQYFLTHTYEGRLNTPLRGAWDLEGGMVSVRLPADASRSVNARFALMSTAHPSFLRADVGGGWYPEEHAFGGDRWRWTAGEAQLRLENPQSHPISATITLDARSWGEREVRVALADKPDDGTVEWRKIGESRERIAFGPVVIPPGRSTVLIHSKQPPRRAPGDVRAIALCVYRVTLEPKP